MYGIYANIWCILMVNVTIHSIHGSYGINIYIYIPLFLNLPPHFSGQFFWSRKTVCTKTSRRSAFPAAEDTLKGGPQTREKGWFKQQKWGCHGIYSWFVIAKLVQITSITMVYGTCNFTYIMGFINHQNITGWPGEHGGWEIPKLKGHVC